VSGIYLRNTIYLQSVFGGYPQVRMVDLLDRADWAQFAVCPEDKKVPDIYRVLWILAPPDPGSMAIVVRRWVSNSSRSLMAG